MIGTANGKALPTDTFQHAKNPSFPAGIVQRYSRVSSVDCDPFFAFLLSIQLP